MRWFASPQINIAVNTHIQSPNNYGNIAPNLTIEISAPVDINGSIGANCQINIINFAKVRVNGPVGENVQFNVRNMGVLQFYQTPPLSVLRRIKVEGLARFDLPKGSDIPCSLTIHDGDYGHIAPNVKVTASGHAVTVKDVGANATVRQSGVGTLFVAGNVEENATFDLSGVSRLYFAQMPPQSVIDNIKVSDLASYQVLEPSYISSVKDIATSLYSSVANWISKISIPNPIAQVRGAFALADTHPVQDPIEMTTTIEQRSSTWVELNKHLQPDQTKSENPDHCLENIFTDKVLEYVDNFPYADRLAIRINALQPSVSELQEFENFKDPLNPDKYIEIPILVGDKYYDFDSYCAKFKEENYPQLIEPAHQILAVFKQTVKNILQERNDKVRPNIQFTPFMPKM